jgi:hypothetical protein
MQYYLLLSNTKSVDSDPALVCWLLASRPATDYGRAMGDDMAQAALGSYRVYLITE